MFRFYGCAAVEFPLNVAFYFNFVHYKDFFLLELEFLHLEKCIQILRLSHTIPKQNPLQGNMVQ